MRPKIRAAVAPLALIVVPVLPWMASSCATANRPAHPTPFDDLCRTPTATVVDTTSSLGPLSTEARTIELGDLVAWHGHPCDGLVAAAAGISHGLRALFPDGPIDRTDLCAATNRSACYGDVAAYLTGARHRYGSLVIDPSLGDTWILHRRKTGSTVRVSLREGVKPAELPGLEAELRVAACPEELMERVEQLQNSFALRVLMSAPERVFVVEWLDAYPYPTGELRPDTAKRDCPPRRP
ncbi:MAG: formylmethanofuran dehydrogenase subunit E family protein [Planctomycetes bacterium]|nr:formylmethanofuran dehydrogenase subunit E family protein [Planctomycetota bacterium]